MVAVDPPNRFLNLLTQAHVFWYARAAGYTQLNHHDFANPVGVLRQHLVESIQLLRDALGVVEPVNASNDLLAPKSLLEAGDMVLRFL